MNKVKLTNTGRSPLGIPGNPLLEAGESINCFNWDELADNKVIAGWVEKGFLTVSRADDDSEPAAVVEQEYTESETDEPATEASESEPEDQAEQEESDDSSEMDEKDEIIAELKTFGVNRDRRTSIEKLRELLDEAKSE